VAEADACRLSLALPGSSFQRIITMAAAPAEQVQEEQEL
jgi:hypothetical protein